MTQFEESVGVDVQKFSESRAVCFDGDALQHRQWPTSEKQLQGKFLLLRSVPLS